MNIDDLKTLMDDFDPASLMPELDELTANLAPVMRIVVMAGPVLLLVMGLIYLLVPPKEANHYLGYRTWFGMGSVDAWRFTQRLAGGLWAVMGLVLTLVMAGRSGKFAGMEVMDLLWTAGKCVLWEAGLVAVSVLAINICAAIRYDSKGERRKAKQK